MRAFQSVKGKARGLDSLGGSGREVDLMSAPASMNGRAPRLRAMTSVGRVLAARPVGRADARLGEARRLFATIVGPGIAGGADVAALRGQTLVVAVHSEHDLPRLQSIEGFVVRTLTEQLGGTRLRRVDYIVVRGASALARVGAPTDAREASVDPATRDAIERMTATIADPVLRERLGQWMGAALARTSQPREGAPG